MKKPLHKHIGQGVKKAHSHFTKYLYERDTIFATFWVFIFIIGLGLLPLNLGFLNPIKLGLKDFDFVDISYSQHMSKKAIIDSNIVIINIGKADRQGLSAIIEKTASFQPKVMGLDAVFLGPKDSTSDLLLSETFKKHTNLVAAAKYQLDTNERLELTQNYFMKNASHVGYVNFPNDDRETTRYFYPFKKLKGTTLPFFASKLLQLYKPEAYHKLEKKGDQKVLINYTRDDTTQYQVIQLEDLFLDNVDSSAIKGRIALLGYVNSNPDDIEDKKFTPMNQKYAGKTIPDMNGIMVHANILSMALENNYIKKLPSWIPWLVAMLLCWLHMSFFIRYYLENHIWFHLVAKIAQVASAIFFVWLGIYLFDRFRIKLDMKLSIVVIIMAVDVIYFYEAWATWMHKKYNFRTVFKQHHHA